MTNNDYSSEYKFVHGNGVGRPLGFMDSGPIIARGASFVAGSRSELKTNLLNAPMVLASVMPASGGPK